jgi:hypothetical protein
VKARTTVVIVASLVAVSGGIAWAVWVRPLSIAGNQLRNYADIQSYASFVRTYRDTHGSLPRTLSEAVPDNAGQRAFWLAARDVYGHPFHYEVNGNEFLIASYGRDGARDDAPYAREGEDRSRTAAPCYDADIDTAYSSDGVFQACSK